MILMISSQPLYTKKIQNNIYDFFITWECEECVKFWELGPAISVPSSDLQLVSGAGSEIVDGVVTMVSLILICEEKLNI